MNELHFREELDENLQKNLGALPVAERPSETMAAGRAAFLNQVESVRASVSPAPKQRHIGWIANMMATFQTRKEKIPMWTAIVTIITILTLALGGGGITVAAAQSAMPDDVLYSVKTWSEDVRYDLATTDEDRLDLALQYAERRMAEIKTMLEQGVPPDQALASRYQAQIETALQLSTGMESSEAAVESLATVYQELLNQQMLMQQIQTQTQSQVQNMGEAQQLMNQFMTQAQIMLQYSMQFAQQGIQDPLFLEQQQQQMQQQQFQFQFSFSFGTQEDFVPGNPWTEDEAGSPSGSGYGFGGGDGITPPDQGQGTRPWTDAPGIYDGNSIGGSANGGGTDNGNSGSNSNGGTNGGSNGGSNGGGGGDGGGGGK